jgi:hypothetical protein
MNGRTRMTLPIVNKKPDNWAKRRNLFPKRVFTAVFAPNKPKRLIPAQKNGFKTKPNISTPTFVDK